MPADTSACVVTGAARGIGKAIAERLERDGRFGTIALLDVDDLIYDVADDVEGAIGYQVDVTDHTAVRDVVKEVESTAPITAAVNNAAVSAFYELRDLDPEEWSRVVDTNLGGYYNLAQSVGPRMYDQGKGYIVNMSSGAALSGSLSAGVHYSAAKAGVLGLTRGLAKELGPHVNVNAVVPGLIDTFGTKDREQTLWTDDAFDMYRRMLPKGRLGDPEEVAGVVAFLCSDDASYMTGSVVEVNGGAHLVPTREYLMG